MPRDFFDPTPEEQHVILIDSRAIREAEQFIESCEYCRPSYAEIPFEVILDQVTGSDPTVTDYLLESPARCPNCRHEVQEKTWIEPGGASHRQGGYSGL